MDDTVAGEVARLSVRLRELGPSPVDPSPVIRTAHPFFGVSLRELRRLAATWSKKHRGAAPEIVLAVADALWAIGVREEMVLATMLLGRRADARELLDTPMIDRWCESFDNWELVDNLAAATLGPWLLAEPAGRVERCHELTRSPDPWARRLGLVTAISLARSPDAVRWWPEVRAIVERLAGDREGSIPKAISWALRSFAATDARPLVEALLADPGLRLPAIARREATAWLATGHKRAGRSRAEDRPAGSP